MLSVGLVLGLGLIPDPGAAGARAAELPPAPILEEDAAATRGWYLRADASLAGLSVSSRFQPTAFDRSRGLEASLGYRLSPILRADVTIGHRFGGTFRAIRLGPADGLTLDRAEAFATTALANGYLDLALLEGITPYLGAGIGVAHDRIGATERLSAAPDGVLSASVVPGGRSRTRLAWAAMTGLAIDWTRNLQFDLGYRYLHSGDRTPRFGGPGRTFDAGEARAHELHFGARFLFD